MPSWRTCRSGSALLATMAMVALGLCLPVWIAAFTPSGVACADEGEAESCPLRPAPAMTPPGAGAPSGGCGPCPDQQRSRPSPCRRCDPLVAAEAARTEAPEARKVAPEPAARHTTSAPALLTASSFRRLSVQGVSPPVHLLAVTLRN